MVDLGRILILMALWQRRRALVGFRHGARPNASAEVARRLGTRPASFAPNLTMEYALLTMISVSYVAPCSRQVPTGSPSSASGRR